MITIDELESQMLKFEEVLEFEKAAELRDQIKTRPRLGAVQV